MRMGIIVNKIVGQYYQIQICLNFTDLISIELYSLVICGKVVEQLTGMFKEIGCILTVMDKNFHNVSMFSHEKNYKENKLKELKIQLSQ